MNWLIYTCKGEHMHSQCGKKLNGIWSVSITSDGHWFTFLLSWDRKRKNEEEEKEEDWRASAHEKVLLSSQRWGTGAAETPYQKAHNREHVHADRVWKTAPRLKIRNKTNKTSVKIRGRLTSRMLRERRKQWGVAVWRKPTVVLSQCTTVLHACFLSQSVNSQKKGIYFWSSQGLDWSGARTGLL